MRFLLPPDGWGRLECLLPATVQASLKRFHAVQLSERYTPPPLPYNTLGWAGVILAVLVAEPLDAGEFFAERVIMCSVSCQALLCRQSSGSTLLYGGEGGLVQLFGRRTGLAILHGLASHGA